jgi:hypothetical protein
MVKFNALQSAKVSEPKTSNRQDDGLNVGLDNKILAIMVENPCETASAIEMAKMVALTCN